MNIHLILIQVTKKKIIELHHPKLFSCFFLCCNALQNINLDREKNMFKFSDRKTIKTTYIANKLKSTKEKCVIMSN